MKIGRLFRISLSLVALVVCASGISRADPTLYSEAATTGYALEADLTIHISTVDGVIHNAVYTTGAVVVDYSRPVGSTPWSVEFDSDETYSYYKVIPGRNETDSNSTCCSFDCQPGGLSGFGGTCIPGGGMPGYPCQACGQICTAVNGHCGSRVLTWFELLYP
jgi:hypothetical protein